MQSKKTSCPVRSRQGDPVPCIKERCSWWAADSSPASCSLVAIVQLLRQHALESVTGVDQTLHKL